MFSVVGALAACTVDASVGAYPDGSTTDAAGDDASLTTDALASDASSDAPGANDTSSSDSAGPVDAGCGATFAQRASAVSVEFVQQTLPAGEGGSILAGTYALTHLRSYLGGPIGTVQFRSTVLIAGSTPAGTLTFLDEATGTSGDFFDFGPTGRYATYTADANTHALFFDQTCPSQESEADRFTATSSTFTLELPSKGVELVYERLP